MGVFGNGARALGANSLQPGPQIRPDPRRGNARKITVGVAVLFLALAQGGAGGLSGSLGDSEVIDQIGESRLVQDWQDLTGSEANRAPRGR